MSKASNLRGVKKYQAANPEKIRELRFLRRYGITNKDWEQMRTKQENRCAICSEIFDKEIHVDHNHTTGKVRELLCGNCNRGLGSFRDNDILLFQAQKYLRKHS